MAKRAPEPAEVDPVDVAARAVARTRYGHQNPAADLDDEQAVKSIEEAAADPLLRLEVESAVVELRTLVGFTRCTSRLASQYNTVVRCMLYAGHPRHVDHFAPAVGTWNDDDDRLIRT